MNNIIKERISASLVLGSYLDTLGFYNGIWEFNFYSHIDSLNHGILINNEIISNFFSFGGFDIDISKWNASDDTILMIATVKACKKGGEEKHFIEEYLKALPLLLENKRGSGTATIKSLNILKTTKNPASIKYSDKLGGNGAAMRTHYIGIHFKDIKKIIEVSIMASKLTHNYVLGFLGGMTMAVFTHYAINNIHPWKWCDLLIELNENGIIDEIMKSNHNDIYEKYMEDKDLFWDRWQKYKEVRSDRFHLRTIEFKLGYKRYEQLFDIIFNTKAYQSFHQFGGTGLSAPMLAYDSLLSSIMPEENEGEIYLEKYEKKENNRKLKYSWQNLVFLSTLHFGDNDTTGAMAGMLYGALRGYDGVNKNVIEMLEFKNEIYKLL
jgi:ADP-ribosylarginine hydrolase